MIRARETKLLSNEKAERMLEAAEFGDAAKILTDCGYEDMSTMTVKEIEETLNAHKSEIFDEINRLAPDNQIVEIFRMKYDYHNAKVIIKSEAMQLTPEKLLSKAGRISGQKLKELYYDEKYSQMPGNVGKAIEKAKSVLATTSNPQQTDFELDRAYLEEMQTVAEKTENEYLIGYVKILVDCANLKSAVRTMRMGKDSEFLKTALIKGGNIDVTRILNANDKDSLLALYAHTQLEKAAEDAGAAIDGGALTEFELACDNAVNNYLTKAKLISFGSEPIVAYLSAVENEITAVRMILTGRLSGVDGNIIKERLRDMYA